MHGFTRAGAKPIPLKGPEKLIAYSSTKKKILQLKRRSNGSIDALIVPRGLLIVSKTGLQGQRPGNNNNE